MGLMDQLVGMLGGAQKVESLAQGQGSFDHPDSPDVQQVGQAFGAAPPGLAEQVLAQAARSVDGGAYREHVTPGVGGTDPLGALGQGGLSQVATTLLGALGGAAGGGGLGSLLARIPGLTQQDPQKMNAQDVAAVADYTRQQNPEAFAQAAAQLSRERPSLLQSLMGNKLLMIAAAGLATKVLYDYSKGGRQAQSAPGPQQPMPVPGGGVAPGGEYQPTAWEKQADGGSIPVPQQGQQPPTQATPPKRAPFFKPKLF